MMSIGGTRVWGVEEGNHLVWATKVEHHQMAALFQTTQFCTCYFTLEGKSSLERIRTLFLYYGFMRDESSEDHGFSLQCDVERLWNLGESVEI